jgi:hypothetical protein
MAEVGGSAGAVQPCTICESFQLQPHAFGGFLRTYTLQEMYVSQTEGCIGCGILVDGIRKFLEVTAGLPMSDINVSSCGFYFGYGEVLIVRVTAAFKMDEPRVYLDERLEFHTLHGMIRQVYS